MSIWKAVVVGLLFTSSLHVYVWRSLVGRTRLPRPWHLALTIVMVVMFASVPVTTWSRNPYPGFAATISWISMPWMAFVGLMAVAFLAIDLGRLVGRLGTRIARRGAPASEPDVSQSRRLFLARVTGGAAMAIGTASVARGMVTARGAHEIVDVEIKLAKLPRELDGFSIVQLSDLHVGLTIDREFVQKVVDLGNGLEPDLFVLTGDLVDGKVFDLAKHAAPLGTLRSRYGTYAVTGNHEYYAGADAWIAHLTSLGIKYLRNDRVTIGDGAASFELAGVDDHGARAWKGHGEDLGRATANRDTSKALVLLAHQPRQVRRAHKFGVDLQLSGHTHGGQIWPWHYIVKLQQGGLLAGWYDYEGTQLYVTRGCGYWGPPVRLLAPLEITRVILRCA